MLNKEEIENKNLLENADFEQGESKSVTNFLEIKCDKCRNKIKFKLGIKNIKDVENYIEQLETKLNKYELREQKLIEKLEQESNIHNENWKGIVIEKYAKEILEILKKE